MPGSSEPLRWVLKSGAEKHCDAGRESIYSPQRNAPSEVIHPFLIQDLVQKPDTMTIFQKIIAREIPAEIVHEEDDFLAFHDVAPQAPVHVLIVPKRLIPRVGEAQASDAELLGRMLVASKEIAQKLGVLESGYRLVINHGRDAGESVPHLHIHLLGNRPLAWPPG